MNINNYKDQENASNKESLDEIEQAIAFLKEKGEKLKKKNAEIFEEQKNKIKEEEE